jgi:hypothetical protein
MKNIIFKYSGIFIFLIVSLTVWSDEPPILTIQPAPEYEYIFGFVEIGKSAEKEMYIINTGKGILSGSVILEDTEQSSSSSGSKEEQVFFLSGDTNFTLFENQSAVVKIQFVPLKAKEYQGKVKVFASENQSAEITLKGIGNKPPKGYYLLGCGMHPEGNVSYITDLGLMLLLILLLSLRTKKLMNE